MIKILTADTSDEAPYPNVENPMLDEIMDLSTGRGFSVMGKFPHLTLIATDGYESPAGVPDYFTVGDLDVVSAKLKAVLETGGAEVEYFPVTLLYRDVPTEISYFVAHPLHLVQAVDLAKSDVEVDEEFGDCVSVEKLVIDESKFGGLNLAIIDEITMIGVQEALALQIESSGCIGCVLVDPLTIRY